MNLQVANIEFETACQLKYLEYKGYATPYYIGKTTLSGCDFNGLFANKHFSAGEIICHYGGTIYRTSAAMKLKDKSYLMRVGEQLYFDAKDRFDVFGR
jgi:hypothetical protein